MGRIDGFIDVGKILENNGILKIDIDSDEFIDNDSIISLTHDAFDNVLLEFRYNNEVYFYKYSWMCTPYSELIANELAHDFGILSVEYDLAILDDRKGVLSKSFKKNDCEYITGEKVLLNFWGDRLDIEHHNNLEDIWDALEYRYRKYSNKKEIVECLMKKIVQIFIFDIITCQNDRHPLNWQIMESNDLVDMVPLYDNQRIVAITGVGSYVSLTIDSHIFGYLFDELKSFLKVSEDYFSDFIKEKIIIIGNENLESIFKRIEAKTGYPMPQDEKEYYLEKFRNHRELLEKELTKCDKIKRKR